MHYKNLLEIIKRRDAHIAIIGLGYVGLPMAIQFISKRFKVTGVDSNNNRIQSLKRGKSYITDISDKEIKSAIKQGFVVTHNEKSIREADVIIISVPTPIRKTKVPDMSYVVKAARTIRKHLRVGQLVILESTTYPGTTREVILPTLELSGIKEGKGFFLAYSPERIDPGNKRYQFKNIPKVVGGISDKAGKLAQALYQTVVKEIVPVKSAESAETVKLLENTFRIVNIALINEFAALSSKLDIDIWEVVEAAKTKPFGFMPFYPGPGVGGHCIPHDPLYLSWKAKQVGFTTQMIDLAAKVNASMPSYVIDRVGKLLKKSKKNLTKSKILVIGVTYKKDVFDIRESPALEIIENLLKRKVKVSLIDAWIRA